MPRRLLALCAGLLLAAWAHSGVDSTSRVADDGTYVPHPKLARLTTLGFDALVADAYWLQAVQIVGGEERGVGRHATLIARLVDVVTSLDPWVDHPYRFAALWLTGDLDSVLSANELLGRGIAYHPREWRNRHYLGFNHFFYLGDEPRAADVLEGAIGLPRAPAYLASLVAKLRVEQGGLDAAALYLRNLADHAEDGFARAEHLKALDEIETERRARFLDGAREAYRRRHGRDIREVADLLRAPAPLLRALPPAHPHFPGFEWRLHPETGAIVSSFYRERYEPHVHRLERERRERWRREMAERAEQT